MKKDEINNAVAVIEQQAILKVANIQERNAAIELCKQIKARRDEVVEFFKDTKAKAYEAWKAIVAQEKSFTDRLDEAEKKIKAAVLTFDKEEEARRLEEQRRLQAEAEEAARKERERLEKLAKKAKSPEKKAALIEQAACVIAPVVCIPQAPKTDVSVRKVWKARVVDETKVPREFLVVNEKALDAYAKATKGKIPVAGVEFYEQEIMAVK